jgi:hypothetical protein
MPDNRNCKNYETDGGDTWEVGGALDIQAGGAITANGVQANAVTKPVAGTTVDAESRAAINAIIDALKAVGITK